MVISVLEGDIVDVVCSETVLDKTSVEVMTFGFSRSSSVAVTESVTLTTPGIGCPVAAVGLSPTIGH